VHANLVDIVNELYGDVMTYNCERCMICLDFMGTQYNELDCGHWAHWKCLLESMDMRCPICRQIVELPDSYKLEVADVYLLKKLKHDLGL